MSSRNDDLYRVTVEGEAFEGRYRSHADAAAGCLRKWHNQRVRAIWAANPGRYPAPPEITELCVVIQMVEEIEEIVPSGFQLKQRACRKCGSRMRSRATGKCICIDV